eukprot:CAMPEP_0178930530 /NCGR_PEP_ID=MMETSP0786-20121207/21297_1 /TAXON_ID=186022 /ORGANISM="Thalassionema frauenfeldii, Strain CCMP 1798" /LENGTH=913 /DNA_ID=CAMNT_0020607089 /DNA_START=775 /DNA_END=3516 /DNA_ORIENTATION=-
MSDTLAQFIRSHSQLSFFRDLQMEIGTGAEILIGKEGTTRRQDFETYRDRLRIALVDNGKETREITPIKHRLLVGWHSPKRVLTKANCRPWDPSKYKQMQSEYLGDIEMELAFLLEQAYRVKANSLWDYVDSNMSDALADFIDAKRRTPSFAKQRLRVLIGDISSHRRRVFDSFRRMMREENFPSHDEESPKATMNKTKKMREERSSSQAEASRKITINKTKRVRAKLQANKTKLEPATIPFLPWDATKYKRMESEYLGFKEMELAFLLEQARSRKVPDPWKHVDSHMSDALADFINLNRQTPSFTEKRLTILIGDTCSPRRRVFESFRRNLRQSEDNTKGETTGELKDMPMQTRQPNAIEIFVPSLTNLTTGKRVSVPCASLGEKAAATFMAKLPSAMLDDSDGLGIYVPSSRAVTSSKLIPALGFTAKEKSPATAVAQCPQITSSPQAKRSDGLVIFRPSSRDMAKSKTISVPVSSTRETTQTTTVTELSHATPESVVSTGECWDVSRYRHLCPKGLNPVEMELAFLLEQSRTYNAISPWKYVETYMSSNLSDFVRSKSYVKSFTKGRVRALIGRSGEAHREDFELFRRKLRSLWSTDSHTVEKDVSALEPYQKGKTVTLGIVIKGVVIAKHEGLVDESFAFSAGIETMGPPAQQKHLKMGVADKLPPWEASECGQISSELLTPEQRELAYLLAEGDIIAPEDPWGHAKSHMSLALGQYMRHKEQHLLSFQSNRLRALIGETSTPKRRAFEFCRSKFAKLVMRNSENSMDNMTTRSEGIGNQAGDAPKGTKVNGKRAELGNQVEDKLEDANADKKRARLEKPLGDTLKNLQVDAKSPVQQVNLQFIKGGDLNTGRYPRQRILLSALVGMSLFCFFYWENVTATLVKLNMPRRRNFACLFDDIVNDSGTFPA